MNLEIEAYEGELRELRQALAQDSLRKLAEIDRELGLFDEQALAQPEQEPVGYVTLENISSWAKVPSIKWFKKPTDGPLYTAPPALAQPEQEPVAWVYNGILHEFDPSEFATSEVTPLYTAPQKREWVGLTDEEIEECKINGGLPHAINWRLSVKVMEAKLKEKNG